MPHLFKNLLLLLVFCAVPLSARATSAQRDARMDGYLAIWSRNAAITPVTVSRLYARRVDYYGQPMSAEAVYRDKLAFVRRWPIRSYVAIPGTVTNDCTDDAIRCHVTAILRWHRADRVGRGQSGTNSVKLDLVRQDGTLKIGRESGAPVIR